MIADILNLCSGHNGVLRWILMQAEEAGIEAGGVPVSSEFLSLFPIERFDGDIEAQHREDAKRAEACGAGWVGVPFAEVISHLRRYEQEASAIEHTWPRLTPVACQALSERCEPDPQHAAMMMDGRLATDLVEPFLVRALDVSIPMEGVLRKAIATDTYRRLAIYHILRRPVPSLYPEIEALLPQYLEHCGRFDDRAPFSEAIMASLLSHPDKNVRFAAAIAEFRATPTATVRESLKAAWRPAMVEGLASEDSTSGLRSIHDLDKMVAYDRTLAYDILALSLRASNSMLTSWELGPLAPLVSALTTEEKSKLLPQCANLVMTDFVGLLVGDDLDLYRQLLATDTLRRHHLGPLTGDPSAPSWTDKAVLALQAGYSPKEISHAARGFHWGGSGKQSVMWQGWIDSFFRLLGHPDTRIKEVGRAGIDWATTVRDQAIAEERYEDVHGRFEE
jgi:hypothetical protein